MLVPQTSRNDFAGQPAGVSWNVGCFLGHVAALLTLKANWFDTLTVKQWEIYQLFWTQACPEGMYTNGTQPVKVGHTTGVYYPYSFRIVMGVLLRPTRTNHWKSFSTKTRKSNHLQMSLQRQHFLLSYLKTLSVGPVGFEPATSCWADQRSPNWANQAAIK